MKKDNIIVVSRSESITRIIADQLEYLEFPGRITGLRDVKQVEERIATAWPDLIFFESCSCHCAMANRLARLLRKHKRLHIIVFSVGACSPRAAARFIYWGVESYVNLRDSSDEFRRGLRLILDKKPYVPEYVANITDTYDEAPALSTELTKREHEIVHLLATGKSADEIAAILHLAPKTVENHKANMYGKCNVRNSVELFGFALHEGILQMEDLWS